MKRLLTPEEIAEALVVPAHTVREWLRIGKLKGIKAGKRWRVREEDLREFLNIPPAEWSPRINPTEGGERQIVGVELLDAPEQNPDNGPSW